ncbi:MAG TPA: DUF5698 domain-containing protein [Kiritimatiellia bacterium]|jgi:uncharacterized protein YebE (UPF0316 family)|nr:DUF5698 domain-containing protein [Kiritimatiellia bacterium]
MPLLLQCLLIVAARIVDVSMGTLRVSFIARGRKFFAAACGFTEILIWIVVVARIFHGPQHWLAYVAYALGFTLGTFAGMSLEERLAIGWTLVRVITSKPVGDFPEKLAAAGFGVTRQDARGARGPVQVLVTLMPRRRLLEFQNLLRDCDPTAFYTIEDVRHARDIPPAYATAATAAGKIRMPPI